jgi:hypothetical protein
VLTPLLSMPESHRPLRALGARLPENKDLYNWLMVGINIINIEEDDEPLKGRPQTVRLEKTDYQLGQSAGLLVVTTEHDSGGRVTERRVYRFDGTLSFHESFQYEADPPGCTVRILDAQGAIVSTRRILTGPEGEESIVASASGEISERTRTRRDSQGRVIEATSEEMIGNKEIRMQVDYGAGQGEARVALPQGSNIHILAGPEGTRLSYRDSTGRQHEFPRVGTRAVIQSTDEKGNWTSKTIVERDPATGDDVVVASMDRTITYYSD